MVSIGPLVKRLGKRNAALWGIAVAILGQAIMFTAPASLPVVFLGTILKGLGGSPVMGTCLPWLRMRSSTARLEVWNPRRRICLWNHGAGH